MVDVTSKKGMKLLHEGIRYLVIFMLQFSDILVVYVYRSSCVLCLGNPLYVLSHTSLLSFPHLLCNNVCIIFQIGGSKYARIGVLFNANDDATLPNLLFMKVFETTVSSYGSVEFLSL